MNPSPIPRLPDRYTDIPAGRIAAIATTLEMRAPPSPRTVAPLHGGLAIRRVERPDLDRVYQLSHQLLTGRGGGWPLTVFLDPADQVPFFAVPGNHEEDLKNYLAYFPIRDTTRWYSFDATQRAISGGYVAIGYGRDAADVAVYNQFGPALLPAEKRVSVELGAPPSGVN